MKIILLFTALLMFVGGVVFTNEPAGLALGLSPEMEEDTIAAKREQLLASTLQITMLRYRIGDPAYVDADKGLATLVGYQDDTFIISHNHWSQPIRAFENVELRDATGRLLLLLPAAGFHSLVRYQDGGTMVFEAPEQLEGLHPASLSSGREVVPGASVRLAVRGAENGQVDVIIARVETADFTTVPGQMQLRTEEGVVAAGDSGGGVWLDGQLVANLWSVTLEQVRWPWSDWFGDPAERATGEVLAGVHPLNGAGTMTADDLASEAAVDSGYERGPQP